MISTVYNPPEDIKDLKSKEMDGVTQIYFSGGTPVKDSAGFVVRCYDEGKKLQFRAVGAAAVCQMYKSMATARSIFAQKGLEASFRPGFETVLTKRDGKMQEMTVMVGYMDVK